MAKRSTGSKYAPKRETAKSRAAFEAYAALGPSRSLRKLATEWNDGKGSVDAKLHYLGLLSSAFAWQDRVTKHDAEKAEERRRRRESRFERRIDEHMELGEEAVALAMEAIRDLRATDRIGSQAAVQLLATGAQLERDAFKEALKVDGERSPGQIQILILTDASDMQPRAISRPIIESTLVETSE